MAPRFFEQVAALQHRINGIESRLTLEMQNMVKMHEKMFVGFRLEIDSRILQMNEVLHNNGRCMAVHERVG